MLTWSVYFCYLLGLFSAVPGCCGSAARLCHLGYILSTLPLGASFCLWMFITTRCLHWPNLMLAFPWISLWREHWARLTTPPITHLPGEPGSKGTSLLKISSPPCSHREFPHASLLPSCSLYVNTKTFFQPKVNNAPPRFEIGVVWTRSSFECPGLVKWLLPS